jgi:hypothetical protein
LTLNDFYGNLTQLKAKTKHQLLSKICRREFRYCRRETENDGFTTAVFCRGEKI